MTTFIDTSAFLALLNGDDRHHAPAAEFWERLLEEGEQPICNNYVLVETFALLQYRFGVDAVAVFHEDMLPVVVVKWIDEALHTRAVSALLAAGRRRVSFVDWSMIEMMRAVGARRIFAFDRHYSDYGFETVPGTTR